MIDWTTFNNNAWLGTRYWDKKISKKDNFYFDDVSIGLFNDEMRFVMSFTEATISESFNKYNGNFYLD